MQLVSASKMMLLGAQEYAQQSVAITAMRPPALCSGWATEDTKQEPLFQRRPVKRRCTLWLRQQTNSGLAGAYNANVLKLLTKVLKADDRAGIASDVITIGSKGGTVCASAEECGAGIGLPRFWRQPYRQRHSSAA